MFTVVFLRCSRLTADNLRLRAVDADDGNRSENALR
jgi:hypothetical protein